MYETEQMQFSAAVGSLQERRRRGHHLLSVVLREYEVIDRGVHYV